MYTSTLRAQENPIESYRWKHRILLLIRDAKSNTSYQEQLVALGEIDSEFEARKLLVVDVRKNGYRTINAGETGQEKEAWNSSTSLYATYGLREEAFCIVLIGLDGGVKLQQIERVTRRELFDIIDAMPMRRAEIKTKY